MMRTRSNSEWRSGGRGRWLIVVVLLLALQFAMSVTAAAVPVVPTWRIDKPWSTEIATVRIGGDTIVAEIADTSELRSRGLGYRDGLAPGTGMLFVYDSPSIHTFWMKGMRFCLDIIWIEKGTIAGAAENVCPVDGAADKDLPRYPSPAPVTYVLEVPAGWMQERGHAAGDDVTIVFPE